jgi:hypothetical protein
MGIFYKDCPQCASIHAATTVQCGCGYHFDPERVESDDARLELAVHEEQLYEAYLDARLSQARDAVVTARRLHRQDPKDDNHKHALHDAEERLKAAGTELAIQREKTALLLRVATGSKCNGKSERTERLATGEDHARLLPDSKTAAKSRTRKKQPAEERTNARRGAAGRHRAAALPAVPVLTETAESASATAAFRAAQERLARAAAAAERARVESAPVAAKADPAAMPPHVRTRIVERAEVIVAARNMRECPNCLARVLDDVSVCGCGLTLSHSPADMPPLVLEAGEKKSLHDSALAAWISRRR